MEFQDAQRDSAAGFSLLELIVVLSIVAIAAALVVPPGRGPNAKASLDRAAASLAATLRIAKAESQRKSTDQTVTLDLDHGSYWSDAEPQQKSFGQRINVTIQDDTFEWAGNTRRIRIQPGGSATGGTIVLADGTARARVTLDWLTGSTRLSLGQ